MIELIANMLGIIVLGALAILIIVAVAMAIYAAYKELKDL